MKTEPIDIDSAELTRQLAASYGRPIAALSFVPKGEEAYAYLAEQSDGARLFIRAQETSRATMLETVYRAVHELHTEAGITSVLAPYTTLGGRFTLRYGRYSVAMFPFIAGSTLYEQGATAQDVAQQAAIMAELHRSAGRLHLASLPHEHFENPFKEPILLALETAGRLTAAATCHQRRLAQLLMTEQVEILATLDHMERLQREALQLMPEQVLTHGDPNRANFLKDPGGKLHLTDWGELALGPAERDLSAFTGEGFETFLRHYTEAGQRPLLHPSIFAFYFYRWTMQEIADYATRILFRQLGAEEDAHAWEELQPYLPIAHGQIAQGVEELKSALA